LGRMLTDSLAGISPSSLILFIPAQIIGGLLALLFANFMVKSSNE